MTLIFITLRHYYTHARRRPVSRVSMVERMPAEARSWRDRWSHFGQTSPSGGFRWGSGAPRPVGRPQVSVTPRERPVVCAAARRRDATVLLDSSIAAMETLAARGEPAAPTLHAPGCAESESPRARRRRASPARASSAWRALIRRESRVRVALR